jgi:Raf kinase inhibitor-like YbhB/YbcL family protein
VRSTSARLLSDGLALLALAAAAAAPLACDRDRTADMEETVMTFSLTSAAFKHNERIPVRYTGEGADVSPPLEWSDPPAGTQSLALICADPDAPVGTWDHWVLWNVAPDRRSLPEKIVKFAIVPDLGSTRQGKNSWPSDNVGYRGPMPPPGHGTHHYQFTLYALDTVLDLPPGHPARQIAVPGPDKRALVAAMKGHLLGKATLTGLYSR